MASENETVHFVTEEMREPVFRYGGVDSVVSLRLRDYANRIEAAHRCEVAELRECLQEAINNECNYCRTIRSDGTYGQCEHLRADGECDHLRGAKCIVHKWRKALKRT